MEEQLRKGELFEIQEDENGTYIWVVSKNAYVSKNGEVTIQDSDETVEIELNIGVSRLGARLLIFLHRI